MHKNPGINLLQLSDSSPLRTFPLLNHDTGANYSNSSLSEKRWRSLTGLAEFISRLLLNSFSRTSRLRNESANRRRIFRYRDPIRLKQDISELHFPENMIWITKPAIRVENSIQISTFANLFIFAIEIGWEARTWFALKIFRLPQPMARSLPSMDLPSNQPR